MKLKYYGTAAAEGWPGMFCTCDNCKRAAASGGRNIRTRSQSAIDDKILIDFPADTYLHILNYGLDLTKFHTCIITHNHTDHLYPADFENRREGFAQLTENIPFTVYGTAPAGTDSHQIIDLYGLDRQGRVFFTPITPFAPFEAEGYTITPLKADHDPNCDPVIYLVSDGRKTILYANDTGIFPEETWSYLEKNRPHLDFVSLDCTLGSNECFHGHMGFSANLEVRKRLTQLGCADSASLFSCNHFSHNGNLDYDEFLPVARQQGFLVSYDGMAVEF